VVLDKEGIFFFIFKPINADGRDSGRGRCFGGGGGPVPGLVGANAPMPSLCFVDIPPPAVSSEGDMSAILTGGLSGRRETFMVGDGTSAAILLFVSGTNETVLIRGTSGEDGSENKDVWEAARGRMPFYQLVII